MIILGQGRDSNIYLWFVIAHRHVLNVLAEIWIKISASDHNTVGEFRIEKWQKKPGGKSDLRDPHLVEDHREEENQPPHPHSLKSMQNHSETKH